MSQHIYQGDCPDERQPNSRDPNCPACNPPTGKLPEPPKPDTHCWDDDARVDVWSYSAYQLNQYGAECYIAGIEAAFKAALSAPVKAARQDQREACAAAIRGMM